ncbi:MAG: hypothetical protein KatS3mg053_2780 [Candidatus Roseilinea sp.]|nr:MAG: hypothetical protein KatS3mg053_2780 [Candidatus Roseilinea sp.]
MSEPTLSKLVGQLSSLPVKVTTIITPFSKDDPRFQVAGDDGMLHPMGFSLADLAREAKDGILEWTEPIRKTTERIDLRPFLEQFDPQTTYLNFRYEVKPDDDALQKDPNAREAWDAYGRETKRFVDANRKTSH